MPPLTSLQVFKDALKTRETKITRSLDQLLANRAEYQGTQEYQSFKANASEVASFNPWLRGILTSAGMSNQEVNHIQGWPLTEKVKVWAAVVVAVDAGRPVKFFWEFHGGAAPQTVVDNPGAGQITVTFQSPAAGLEIVEGTNEVTVAV